MAKLLQRVVSDAATRVNQARGSNKRPGIPEMQRADTEPEGSLLQQAQQPSLQLQLQSAAANNGSEYREMLLRHVKREVKQLMEESVTKKFIHEESSIITSLCASVENCLLYGLKISTVSIFRDNMSHRLLQKIAKEGCPEAKQVLEKMAAEPDGGAGGSKDGRRPAQIVKYQWIRAALLEKCLSRIVEHLVKRCRQFYESDSIIGDPSDGPLLASLIVGPCALDYTKVKTLDHSYTDPSADELLQRHRIITPLGSPGSPKTTRAPSLKDEIAWLKRLTYLLSSDNWAEQSGIEIKRHPSTSSEESLNRSAPPSAKEYVELLHQNSRSALLFGKNNVQSQTPALPKRVPGYLSLHQTQNGDSNGLIVKWTPNSLMLGGNNGNGGNGGSGPGGSGDASSPPSLPANAPHSPGTMGYSPHARRPTWATSLRQSSLQTPPQPPPSQQQQHQSLSGTPPSSPPEGEGSPGSIGSDSCDTRWEAAITINVEDMVYIHCHSNQPDGSSLVFVAHDGTQMPPLIFPPGGHLLQFLTCLENGLLPNGSLDPPLWSHRNKGKVFPQIKRRSIFKETFLAGLLSQDDDSDAGLGGGDSQQQPPVAQLPESDSSVAQVADTDFVFRIVYRNSRFSFESTESTASSDSAFVWQDIKQQPQQQQRQQQQVQQRQQSIKRLCDSMRRQILSRAFYGWLAHVRHTRTVRRHLASLITGERSRLGQAENYPQGLTAEILVKGDRTEICRAVYWGGCRPELRKKVWPLLLGLRPWDASEEDNRRQDRELQMRFENLLSDWSPLDVIVRENDKESASHARQVVMQRKLDASAKPAGVKHHQHHQPNHLRQFLIRQQEQQLTDDQLPAEVGAAVDEEDGTDQRQQQQTAPPETDESEVDKSRTGSTSTATNDAASALRSSDSGFQSAHLPTTVDGGMPDSSSRLSTSRESLVSPASPASNGGVYSPKLIDMISDNWHKIDKDVTRCDRHILFYSKPENLDSLRTIMCSYVWEHIEVGYIQGFCDLLAPLLIVMEDEWLALASFTKLMERMICNFPGESPEEFAGAASPMDHHLANLRALIQVVDPRLYEHMLRKGDYTEFYFFHRWFLLDFKREIYYNDIFLLWETIWAATCLISRSFNVFIAMALLQEYRGVIVDNNMDFTDIIKFYNEMAEQHSVNKILRNARDLVNQLIDLVENQ